MNQKAFNIFKDLFPVIYSGSFDPGAIMLIDVLKKTNDMEIVQMWVSLHLDRFRPETKDLISELFSEDFPENSNLEARLNLSRLEDKLS